MGFCVNKYATETTTKIYSIYPKRVFALKSDEIYFEDGL